MQTYILFNQAKVPFALVSEKASISPAVILRNLHNNLWVEVIVVHIFL